MGRRGEAHSLLDASPFLRVTPSPRLTSTLKSQSLERETRFELATLALARRCSTTELLPLGAGSILAIRISLSSEPQYYPRLRRLHR